jgi:hypothetical protein
MRSRQRRFWTLCSLMAAGCLLTGCAEAMYSTVVKPVPKLSLLSPELENLTDDVIETYLTADVRPVFPSVLAVTKVGVGYRGVLELETIRGQEAEGWRAMAGKGDPLSPRLLDQVQLVSPMLASQQPTLKSLRDAAALLHAPLLVVYLQQDSSDDGYNSAAMAYWTIIGLFLVPGHTVGHYSTCQAVLIDTRSGFVLATAYGESLKEENVLPGAVPIAIDRTCRQAREAAVAALQQDFRATLAGLAVGRGVLGR